MSYNPIPPRVWSRVQNPCTYTDASGNSDINYNQVYIPLTKQTVTQAQANYEDKMIYKGNVLQYKGNSSRLTKSQKYTQLAKGFGPNRTKVFATQSQTYTNPNTTGLQRVNTQTYPYPIGVVGAPNNISGPYQYNVQNPNGCSNNSIQDGGTLNCGYYVNPCTGDIIRSGTTSSIIYNPASASGVPGSSDLFWDNKVQTWFPKSRYVMNNSTDKWPVNYKGLDGYSGLVSATSPDVPILTLDASSNTSVTLSWTVISNNCIPISSYNIYQNGVLVQTQPFTITSTTIYNLSNCENSFYVTSVSNTTESFPSNIIITIISLYPLTTVTINNNAPNTATLTWNQPLSTVNSFNIYRSDSGNPYTLITNVLVSSYPMSFIDNTLTNNVTYSYYITFIDDCGESLPSNIVSVTPLPLYTVTGSPTETQSGGYYWVVYDIAGTFIFNYNLNMEFSLIGGGSGGAFWFFEVGTNSGGGGQVLSTDVSRVVTPNTWSIIVGQGGAGGTSSALGNGITGGNSSIGGTSFSVTTNNSLYAGGGGLGVVNDSYNGGGGLGNGITSASPGTYDSSSGNAGGAGGGSLTLVDATNTIISVALGGVGSNGQTTYAGNGGSGQTAIDSSLYGGGGGGGVEPGDSTPPTFGTGGSGGGGDGADNTTSAQNGTLPGGGGGGGCHNNVVLSIGQYPGTGANGRVILKFNQA